MRLPRSLTIAVTGIFHKMWRGHNREYVLGDGLEKNTYLNALFNTFTGEFKTKISLHSFCLMGNHSHEIGRVIPGADGGLKHSVRALGDWMRNAHSRFGVWYNRRHKRQGTKI